MQKGKLIVLDGIDGSGKATQVKLLEKRLKKEGKMVKTIDFPHYKGNFFGSLIGEYLAGRYGDFSKIDPRAGSIFYAADRFESSQKIKDWLDGGNFVLIDRYASANQIHQGGKIKNLKERREFMNWLDTMEHKIFKIPRPDLVVFLDVPFEVSKMWLQKKVAQKKKTYLKGRKDVTEDNFEYLKDSRKSALLLEKENKNWEKVVCCKGMICLSPESVHEEVFKIIKSKFKI